MYICHEKTVCDATVAATVADVSATHEVNRQRAQLIAAAPDLLEALKAFTKMYVQMIESGDCGNWNPEEDAEVIQARKAIAKAEGKTDA
ncbi:hypothetical protein WH95_18380 [Kiloniella litopenaei]|uniref:Uncharacterized protein n=1 Tax=Kiloniella litopenaei TaxID=1549748 RepID=A0A0M2R0P6_9PROT|nr:hypothetical protein WH95_18380 [Kiloniella litopenaei]